MGVFFSKIISTKKAFTLIEVLIAIAVLTIGVLTVIQLFPWGYRLGTFSKEMTVATNLASLKMEELSSYHYDDLTAGVIEPKERISNDPQNQFYYYQRQAEVNLVDENLNDSALDLGLKKIIVTVYFQEGGKEKNIILTTLRAKK